MAYLDQEKILFCLDMLITLTEFIKDRTMEGKFPLPGCQAGAESANKAEKDERVFDPDRHNKTLTNVLRRLILRVQPYMTPSTLPALSIKSMTIFENVVPYLAKREMVPEQSALTFS